MWLLTQDEADYTNSRHRKSNEHLGLRGKSRCIQVATSAQHAEGCWPACLCLCLGERQVLFSLLIHFLSHSSCAIAIENCNRVWEALGFWVLPPDWTGECCCSGIMCEYHLLRGAGSLRGFCWRGTFSQDSRQGEQACLPSFLSKLLVVTGFPFCFPVELFLCLARGLSCFSCGFWGCFSFIFFPCVGFLLEFSMHTNPGNKSGSFASVYCSTRVNVECLSCFEKLLPKIWPAHKKVSREGLRHFGTDFLLAGGVVLLGMNVSHLQCTVAF